MKEIYFVSAVITFFVFVFLIFCFLSEHTQENSERIDRQIRAINERIQMKEDYERGEIKP